MVCIPYEFITQCLIDVNYARLYHFPENYRLTVKQWSGNLISQINRLFNYELSDDTRLSVTPN